MAGVYFIVERFTIKQQPLVMPTIGAGEKRQGLYLVNPLLPGLVQQLVLGTLSLRLKLAQQLALRLWVQSELFFEVLVHVGGWHAGHWPDDANNLARCQLPELPPRWRLSADFLSALGLSGVPARQRPALTGPSQLCTRRSRCSSSDGAHRYCGRKWPNSGVLPL